MREHDSGRNLLCAEAISFRYGAQQVLHEVSCQFQPGESYALVGASGSGKSTLLQVLSGILVPQQGRVRLGDLDVSRANRATRTLIRRRDFGFVFQNSELLPELSILQNVALPLMLNGAKRSAAYQAAVSLAEQLGIKEVVDQLPRHVSGGQLQRAAIARAVIHSPRVIIADEPTGALDSENGRNALDLLLARGAEVDATVLVATHDSNVAERLSNTVRIADGHVVSEPRQVAKRTGDWTQLGQADSAHESVNKCGELNVGHAGELEDAVVPALREGAN